MEISDQELPSHLATLLQGLMVAGVFFSSCSTAKFGPSFGLTSPLQNSSVPQCLPGSLGLKAASGHSCSWARGCKMLLDV